MSGAKGDGSICGKEKGRPMEGLQMAMGTGSFADASGGLGADLDLRVGNSTWRTSANWRRPTSSRKLTWRWPPLAP